MFERFEDDAKAIVILAQEIARDMKHNYIGTEHVLLAMLKKDDTVAAYVLNDLGLTTKATAIMVMRIVGVGREAPEGIIPITPRLKKCFELALRETLSLGMTKITPEMMLIGIVREQEGVAARVLLDLGDRADYEVVRSKVLKILEDGVVTTSLIRLQIDRQTEIRNQANAELRRLRSLLKKAEKIQSQK